MYITDKIYFYGLDCLLKVQLVIFGQIYFIYVGKSSIYLFTKYINKSALSVKKKVVSSHSPHGSYLAPPYFEGSPAWTLLTVCFILG